MKRKVKGFGRWAERQGGATAAGGVLGVTGETVRAWVKDGVRETRLERVRRAMGSGFRGRREGLRGREEEVVEVRYCPGCGLDLKRLVLK